MDCIPGIMAAKEFIGEKKGDNTLNVSINSSKRQNNTQNSNQLNFEFKLQVSLKSKFSRLHNFKLESRNKNCVFEI